MLHAVTSVVASRGTASFYWRKAKPGEVVVEGRIPAATRKELEARGHNVTATGDWTNGMVMAVQFGLRPGVLAGAVWPRGQTGYVTGDGRR